LPNCPLRRERDELTVSVFFPIFQKQTVQSKGIWETFRRAAAISPDRSNGIPLNPYYRTPAPGSEPTPFEDPVTLPAADLADNPYWKRDVRRAYPKLSVVNQSDAVALLTLGSAASPKVELIGEAGEKQLVEVQQQSETGLAKCLETASKDVVAKDLFVNGLPPLPSGQVQNTTGDWEVYKYELAPEDHGSYGEG
jgi:hypothetical protein